MTSAGVMASGVLASAIPSFKTALGQAVSMTSSSSISIATTAAIAVGDLIVVRIAADNISAVAPTFTCSDAAGNSYTTHAQIARGAAAAGGVAAGIMCSLATVAMNVGNAITVTLTGGAVAAKAVFAQSFTGWLNTLRVAATSQVNLNAAPSSLTTGAPAVGDLALGCIGMETRGAITGDGDTGGGLWSTLVAVPSDTVAADATCVTVSGQYKIVTSTAGQTYNNACPSTDWAAMCLIMQKA